MSKTKSNSGTYRAALSAPIDAIALLEGDHRDVEALFTKFEKSEDDDTKSDIAQKICKGLTIHQIVEEEIFYPAVNEYIDDEIYNEAHVEHDCSKVLIAEIMAGSPDDQFYDAKVKVLSEMVKHHVEEEEQRNGLFAQAKRGHADLKGLGEKMAAKKDALLVRFDRYGYPPPETKVMAGGKLTRGTLEST
jgi:hypothetical protein